MLMRNFNPLKPTGRSERHLPPIPLLRQDVPNVTSQPSTRADRTFRTSIPQCQIRKARCFILLCGLGVKEFSIIMRAQCERVKCPCPPKERDLTAWKFPLLLRLFRNLLCEVPWETSDKHLTVKKALSLASTKE